MMSNGKCQAKFIYMRTLSFGISLLFILNGCVSNSEKKAEENIILYPGEYRVMKEGSFYPVLPVIYKYVW